MGDVIGEILPMAVGVAVSPVPIAAVIVMLFTPRAKTNGPSFMVGWIVGLLLVSFAVLLVPGIDPGTGGEPTTTSGIVKGLLGLGLLVVAVASWKKRPGPGETAEMPGWMGKIDSFGMGKSFGIGFLLSAVNPKNLMLILAAAITIVGSSLEFGSQVTAILIFTAIAAVTVVVPVVGYLIIGDRADEAFSQAKDWLINNNSVVMAVLLLVFGVKLIGDAIGILL